MGELRPEALGVDLGCDGVGGALAEAAIRNRLPVLLHASEPVGHAYPGKAGQSLGPIWRFITAHPDLVTVLAHLGGGLPFFAHMPEVRAIFARTYVDTAAAPWLYDKTVYRPLVEMIGADRILFASDFPLRDPALDLAILRDAGLPESEINAILAANAMSLLNHAGPPS